MSYLINPMYGLGDNIYLYPIVSELSKHSEILIRTPWPQLFSFLKNVKCTWTSTHLRTQAKNERSNRDLYVDDNFNFSRVLSPSYVRGHQMGKPIWQALCESIDYPLDQYKLTGPWINNADQKIALIRPGTVRQEWKAESRCCRQEYIQSAIDILNTRGYRTVVVADIAQNEEWYYEFRPERASVYYEHGEKSFEDLLHLAMRSKVIVGGVGFIVPMAMFTHTKSIIIHGGAGGWNSPEKIDAPCKVQPMHILPDPYCRCQDHSHSCNKMIPYFTRMFNYCMDLV